MLACIPAIKYEARHYTLKIMPGLKEKKVLSACPISKKIGGRERGREGGRVAFLSISFVFELILLFCWSYICMDFHRKKETATGNLHFLSDVAGNDKTNFFTCVIPVCMLNAIVQITKANRNSKVFNCLVWRSNTTVFRSHIKPTEMNWAFL